MTYILNRVPTKSVISTPYELWTGRKPELGHLRPWGSAAYVHDPSSKYGKLGQRGKKCIFIRYSEHSKGYVFIGEHIDGGMTELESRDVTFIENEFPSKSDIDKSVQIEELEDQDITITPSQISKDQPRSSTTSGSDSNVGLVPNDLPTRRSNRTIIPRHRFEIEGEAFMLAVHDSDEPKNVNEALMSHAREQWIKAMEEEMESMKVNHVWDLVDLPPNRKAIGNKWVLRIKRKADGTIERYKARLVAKGYTQQEGIDYEETFSPVVRFASIRLILAIVAHMDLELHQMDVKTAFLNGDLEEEIYMDQPISFVAKG